MECEMENSKFMLACSKCERLTHYRYTKLPAYQVTLFMKKGYRLYVCSLCVGEIDEEILGNCTEKSTEHTSLNMRTNHQLNVKTSNEELLEHKVRYLEKELAISNRKLVKCKQDETKNSTEEYSDSIETQNIVLKQQIEDIEAERDALIIKLKNLEQPASSCSGRSEKVINKEPLKSTETILDTNLVSIEERVKQTMVKELENRNKVMDGKLDTAIKETKTYAQSLNVYSVESSGVGVPDFRSILQEAKNDERVEEREKEKRTNNFIIHGLEEEGTSIENVKNNDKNMVKLFFQKINIENKPKSFYRLGIPAPGKNRPLKVEMTNNTERELVLNNLQLLKGTELGKLSIRENLTKNDRKQVKKYVDSARNKNNEDPSHRWVVRGSSKNGWHLMNLTRK